MAFRIDIQDRVRRFALDPREDDGDAIRKLQEGLSIQLEVLEDLRHRVAADVFVEGSVESLEDPAAFDNLDMENTAPNADVPPATTAGPPVMRASPAAAALTSAAILDVLPPESRRLSIPSRWQSTDNIYHTVELKLCILQADKTLQALRDTIVDKSN